MTYAKSSMQDTNFILKYLGQELKTAPKFHSNGWTVAIQKYPALYVQTLDEYTRPLEAQLASVFCNLSLLKAGNVPL